MSRQRLLSMLYCALLLGSTACSLFSSRGPDDAFRAFADALQRKDGAAAAASTDDPNTATAAITSMFDGMGKDATVKVDASQAGDDEKAAKLELHVVVRTRQDPALRRDGDGHPVR